MISHHDYFVVFRSYLGTGKVLHTLLIIHVWNTFENNFLLHPVFSWFFFSYSPCTNMLYIIGCLCLDCCVLSVPAAANNSCWWGDTLLEPPTAASDSPVLHVWVELGRARATWTNKEMRSAAFWVGFSESALTVFLLQMMEDDPTLAMNYHNPLTLEIVLTTLIWLSNCLYDYHEVLLAQLCICRWFINFRLFLRS